MENAIWRIIDVNFNRGREAARVIEEYARFALNSSILSAKAKELRHELCRAVGRLDQAKLLACRDIISDVGCGLEIDAQHKRRGIDSVFIAAAKRLPEALRALSEAIETLEPSLAKTIENLRYRAYDLEKEITLRCNSRNKYKDVKLYVLLDETLGESFGSVARACIDGGADCLQLRAKCVSDSRRMEMAEELVSICRSKKVVSIINDRVDIALACGADGVHLGQDDLPIETVKKLLTQPMVIGLSTHNPEQLRAAIEAGVDYVGLGPTFKTTTKDFSSYAGIEYLKAASDILKTSSIVGTAIGGICAENVDMVKEAGINSVAVCSAVTSSNDPTLACAKIKEILLS